MQQCAKVELLLATPTFISLEKTMTKAFATTSLCPVLICNALSCACIAILVVQISHIALSCYLPKGVSLQIVIQPPVLASN